VVSGAQMAAGAMTEDPHSVSGLSDYYATGDDKQYKAQ